MSWLRIDDVFDEHPKILKLTEVQRWRWTTVLLYCARSRSKGIVTLEVLRKLKVTGATVTKFVEVGLLNRQSADTFEVNDWLVFNGETIEEKLGAYMRRHPNASANEAHKAIGGNRQVVLEAHAAWVANPANKPNDPVPNPNQAGTEEPPMVVPDGGTTEPGQVVPGVVPNRYQSLARVHAHARVRSPSPSQTPSPQPLAIRPSVATPARDHPPASPDGRTDRNLEPDLDPQELPDPTHLLRSIP